LSLDTVGKSETGLWEPIEALQAACESVSATRDLGELCELAMGLALDLTGATVAFVGLVDESGARDRVFTHSRDPDRSFKAEDVDSLLADATAKGKGSWQPQSVSSFAALQLRAGGDVIGVFGVAGEVPLSAAHRQAFSVFVSHLAGAIEIVRLRQRRQEMIDSLVNLRADLDRSEKARMVEHARTQAAIQIEKAHELAVEALLAVSIQARGGQSFADFYSRLTTSVSKLVGADKVLFWQLNENRTLTAIPGGHGIDDDFMSRLYPAPAEPYGDDLTSRVVHQGEIFRASRSAGGNTYQSVLDLLGVSSAISVPWRAGQQRMGVVAAYDSRRPDGFSDEDAWVLQMVGLAAGLVWQLKLAEGDLSKTIDRLQKVDMARQLLLKNLSTAVDKARKRFAGELHDDALQKLTAAELHLRRITEQPGSEQHRGSAATAQGLLEQAEEALRKLLFEVQPPALDVPGGFEESIRDRLTLLRSLTGIEAEAEVELADELPYELKSMIFRQVAEALTNVEKHAGAKHVIVAVRDRDGGIHGQVVDDGSGFVVEERDRLPGHLGLLALKERALLAGGWCEITSVPGEGTKVEFWVPAPS
jgi:signal transduction histidine kinase